MAVLSVVILGGISAQAQGPRLNPLAIESGATIRFRIRGDYSYRSGVLARLTADSVIVERCPTCQGRLFYDQSELTRLDVSRRIPAGPRILSGFAIGAIAGFALGYVSAATCTGGDQCDFGVVAVAFGGLFGGLVGATVGYLTSYKWESVPLTRQQQ